MDSYMFACPKPWLHTTALLFSNEDIYEHFCMGPLDNTTPGLLILQDWQHLLSYYFAFSKLNPFCLERLGSGYQRLLGLVLALFGLWLSASLGLVLLECPWRRVQGYKLTCNPETWKI